MAKSRLLAEEIVWKDTRRKRLQEDNIKTDLEERDCLYGKWV
jgi:hypothetical protein